MSGGKPREIKQAGGKFHDERFQGWDAAERRALHDYLADLPDPAEYAQHLRLHEAQALMTAQWGGPDGTLFVLPEAARILAPLGLCEVGCQRHNYLGSFG